MKSYLLTYFCCCVLCSWVFRCRCWFWLSGGRTRRAASAAAAGRRRRRVAIVVVFSSSSVSSRSGRGRRGRRCGGQRRQRLGTRAERRELIALSYRAQVKRVEEQQRLERKRWRWHCRCDDTCFSLATTNKFALVGIVSLCCVLQFQEQRYVVLCLFKQEENTQNKLTNNTNN